MTDSQQRESIPMGDTIEVVLDRLKRASNFASNGVAIASLSLPGVDPVATASTYLSAAQSMLDEARRALDAVKAAGLADARTTGEHHG